MSKIYQLTQLLQDQPYQYMIVTDPNAIAYLTDYQVDPGERLLVLLIQADGQHCFYLNRLFPTPQLSTDLSQVIDLSYYSDGEPVIEQLAQRIQAGQVAIDKFWSSHFLIDLMTHNPQIIPVNTTLVDDMRAIKSPEEQHLMAQASAGNDRAMQYLIDQVQYGLPEAVMRDKLAHFYHSIGHEGFSFEPIIAYGPNGADPHHETDQSQPQLGDAVVIDIGSMYQGYASDMTRTVFYGQPDETSINVYELVKAANLAGIAAVRPGVKFSEIDKAARDVIAQAGYGEYFTHRLGHFIGRQCHEAGDVSCFNNQVAKVGQVFSIEPGIYLPGKIGVRIEDLVIVTETGCQVLNHVSKDLTVITPA